jgi:hypothetical protein
MVWRFDEGFISKPAQGRKNPHPYTMAGRGFFCSSSKSINLKTDMDLI